MSKDPTDSSPGEGARFRKRSSGNGSASNRRGQLTEKERARAEKWVWRAPSKLATPPDSMRVLPQFKAPGICMECVEQKPAETLAERIDACCRRQAAEGLSLSAKFSHGDDLFLVCKRAPQSADPFPRST